MNRESSEDWFDPSLPPSLPPFLQCISCAASTPLAREKVSSLRVSPPRDRLANCGAMAVSND